MQLTKITAKFDETSGEIRDCIDELQDSVDLRIKTALDCYDELDAENQAKLDTVKASLDMLTRAIGTEGKERTYVCVCIYICVCIYVCFSHTRSR